MQTKAEQAAYWQANKDQINARRREKKRAMRPSTRPRTRKWSSDKERKATHYAATRDETLRRIKAYQAANRDKINARDRERNKDPMVNMQRRCRSRITMMLKSFGQKKSQTTEAMLGCTWLHLKAHIEKQFTKGMNWSNRGKWHIDHVIPLASAKDIQEVEALCHFSNLRPIWSQENLSKGCKFITCQPELCLIHL